MSDDLGPGLHLVIRERTPGEKRAYVAGYRAGAKAADKNGLEAVLSRLEMIEHTLDEPPQLRIQSSPEPA